MGEKNNDNENNKEGDTFLTNIIKAFLIVLLTIGLITIRNQLDTVKYLQDKRILQWTLFGIVVIIFMFIMTGVQGSSFMSLLTLVIILIAITIIIWYAAGTTKGK